MAAILSQPQCVKRLQIPLAWWSPDMEMIYVLLALCEGNPLVTGGFPSQMDNNMGFDSFFGDILSKLSKQSSYQWLEMPWHSPKTPS